MNLVAHRGGCGCHECVFKAAQEDRCALCGETGHHMRTLTSYEDQTATKSAWCDNMAIDPEYVKRSKGEA